MPSPPSGPLFATRWVHVFEQDTPGRAVFLPDSADIPLSRRPRAQLAFAPDGSGILYEPGADDRPSGRPLTWHTGDDGQVTARTAAGEDLHVVAVTPERLLIAGLKSG